METSDFKFRHIRFDKEHNTMSSLRCGGEAAMPPCVATIGFFDGVHRGHRYLINKVTGTAAESGGMQSAVITFDRHPRQVLRSEFRPKLLTTPEEKLSLLSRSGVGSCNVLCFDLAMASLSAREFMQSVLFERLNVRKLVIGYDNRFGHDRTDGFEEYVAYGREMGMEVIRCEAFEIEGVKVSSSVIRTFLSGGEAGMAAMCLGYPYFLNGTVVSGLREGRKMGFPTANLSVDDADKLIPGHGVYAVKVRIEGSGKEWQGMTNIGMRPTFGGGSVTIETNIFGFEGDLYGRRITLMFVARLRGERKFASEAKLAGQLHKDKAAAMKILERPAAE